MFINIGFGNMVNADRIIAVVSPETAPIKRLVQDAKDINRAVDVTCGRRTRAVIIMDSDHIILSSIQCETITNRLSNSNANISESENREEDDNHKINSGD